MARFATGEITSILSAAKAGEPGARDELFSLVYVELKKIASSRIAFGNQWAMQATALVHDAYVRMIKPQDASWSDRRHFFRAAARAMRDIIVDRVRYDLAAKRDRRRTEAFPGDLADTCSSTGADIVDLQDALNRLGHVHPEPAEVLELTYFAGFTQDEIADTLGASRSRVSRNLAFAKSWLAIELNQDRPV